MLRRSTIQQRLVLETAQSLCHPSAEAIYQAIAREYPSVSKGTVYRNLKNLAAQGKIRRVSIPGGADRFDITVEPHYHLVCEVCGKVRDADLPYQERIKDLVFQCDDFIIQTHEIIFRGVCGECAGKPR